MKERTKMSVGVIIGRFQVHELHSGHITFINTIMEKHKRVIIFLGISEALLTKRNPMDFDTRKSMLLKMFPSITVLPLKDRISDIVWSEDIDNKIREIYPLELTNNIKLYGSRDSFIPYYHGAFPTIEIDQKVFISGTDVRNNLSETVRSSPDFRAGIIYAAYNQYPSVYPTVDVVVVNNNEILLARKADEKKYRFVGGFVDPTDDNFESAAKRELKEETGLIIDKLKYIGNYKIDDWRYRSEENKIMSTAFLGEYKEGRPNPMDDIVELRWFHLDTFDDDLIVTAHLPILNDVKKMLNIDKGFSND